VSENWLKKVSFIPTTTITFPDKEWAGEGEGGSVTVP